MHYWLMTSIHFHLPIQSSVAAGWCSCSFPLNILSFHETILKQPNKIKLTAPLVHLAFKLGFTGFNLEEKKLLSLLKKGYIERLFTVNILYFYFILFYLIILWTASVWRSRAWFWTIWQANNYGSLSTAKTTADLWHFETTPTPS